MCALCVSGYNWALIGTSVASHTGAIQYDFGERGQAQQNSHQNQPITPVMVAVLVVDTLALCQYP